MVPDEVVIRAGLAAGLELERSVLRRVRSELRRAEAFAVAGRVLSRHDLPRRRLEERLDRAGVPPAVSGQTVAALAESGLVDDARMARARAVALAERGWGDAGIAARLESEGLGADDVHEAVGGLEPEAERARRLVESARAPETAARALARRGFAPETIEELLGALDGQS